MALSVVQAVGAAPTGTGGFTTASPAISTVTAGDLVVCAVMGGAANGTGYTLSVTDSASQSWTSGASAIVYAAYFGVAIFYKANSAAITTVTAHNGTSGTDNGLACQFFEIAGAATTTPADVTDTAKGATSSTAMTVTAGGATAQANDIAVGAFGSWSNVATDSVSGVTAGWSAKTALHGECGTVPYWPALFPYYQILSSTATLT